MEISSSSGETFCGGGARLTPPTFCLLRRELLEEVAKVKVRHESLLEELVDASLQGVPGAEARLQLPRGSGGAQVGRGGQAGGGGGSRQQQEDGRLQQEGLK